MPYLHWISDDDLIQALKQLLEIGKNAKDSSDKKFYKNVIDPFSALFQISAFQIKFEEWENAEKTRQAEKTLQNHIGTFHQSILGSVKNWTNTGSGGGMDLINFKHKIIAEVKNKYNTLTGSKQSDQYLYMEELVSKKSSQYQNFTAYLVYIIPKNPNRFDIPFTPSNRSTGGKHSENKLIRIIDGASFYELATGYPHSLKDLYQVIPNVFKSEFNIDLPPTTSGKLNSIFKKAYGT